MTHFREAPLKTVKHTYTHTHKSTHIHKYTLRHASIKTYLLNGQANVEKDERERVNKHATFLYIHTYKPEHTQQRKRQREECKAETKQPPTTKTAA